MIRVYRRPSKDMPKKWRHLSLTVKEQNEVDRIKRYAVMCHAIEGFATMDLLLCRLRQLLFVDVVAPEPRLQRAQILLISLTDDVLRDRTRFLRTDLYRLLVLLKMPGHAQLGFLIKF